MSLLMVFLSIPAFAQNQTVTGTVLDELNEPVIGATVTVEGTKIATVTDLDGNYKIAAPAGAKVTITYIGYMPLTVKPGGTVKLQEDKQTLEEVVVVGYGTQKKAHLTGSIATVDMDDVQDLANAGLASSLSGLVNGLGVSGGDARPGERATMSIRDVSSFGEIGSTAQEPLYVIDGYIYPNDVKVGNVSQNLGAEAFNNLDASEIESISVLKDASAAVYGARAANGVILVTTKQGKAGKVQVTYDGNIGWSNMYRIPQMLTAKQYMDVQDLVRFNSGSEPRDWSQYVDADLLAAYQNGTNSGSNYLETIRNKNAVTTSHALNITGGSEFSKFSTGIGYQYQDGVLGNIVKSDFRRFTLRLNSEHILLKSKSGDYDVIKIGENVYYQHRQNQGLQQGNQYSNELSNMLRANPLVPIYNANGDYFGYDDLKNSGSSANGWFDYNSYTSNPIAAMMYNQSANNKSISYGLNAVGYVEVQPIKGLIYRGQISYNQSSWSWRTYLPAYKLNDQGASRAQDAATNQTGQGWGWNTTNTLNYKFDIKDKHHFDVLVGTEFSMSKPDYGFTLNADANNSYFGDMKHAYMGFMKTREGHATVSGAPYGDSRGMSYFGRINYDFNETYMFTAIIRADGSSIFAPGKRWGWFPSFSAGWVVTNEKFMQKTSSWLDFLKIRAGWGQNGNKNADAFGYQATFQYGSLGNYSFGNAKDSYTSGAYPARLANNDITWETSEQLDLGLDARFLSGRLGFTFDWYKKTTKDLLLYVPVTPTTGFPTQLQNAGTVRNTGIEIALNWRDKIGKDFNYNVGWNIAVNKNEVTKVNSSQDYNNGGNDLLAQGTGYMARFQEGHPIGYFWGYKTDGVIQNQTDLQNYIDKNCGGDAANSLQGSSLKPGDLKFVDVNGDGVVNAEDKTDLGNPHPDVTMGINIGAEYKGFDFQVTGFAALGQQVARSYRKFTDGEQENYTTEVFSYWNGEGTSNRYPLLARMNEGVNWQSISDIYVENAGYFRLQNLQIGYDFCNIWKSSPFQQLRLYIQAQNLFTITKYKGMDPENGRAINGDEPWVTGVDVGNYPQPRTYLVGVNIKF